MYALRRDAARRRAGVPLTCRSPSDMLSKFDHRHSIIQRGSSHGIARPGHPPTAHPGGLPYPHTPCYGLRHLLARGAVASGRLLPPFLPLAFHPVHELRETGVAPKTGEEGIVLSEKGIVRKAPIARGLQPIQRFVVCPHQRVTVRHPQRPDSESSRSGGQRNFGNQPSTSSLQARPPPLENTGRSRAIERWCINGCVRTWFGLH